MSREYAPNNIRKIRKAKGLSMEELGARMPSGLTMSFIGKLENGKAALSLDYIQEIAEVLQVPAAALFSEALGNVSIIPVIGAVSAGNWGEAVLESNEYVPAPANIKGENLFALRPRGDSMNLIAPEGGFVIVDPSMRDLMNGKVYVVMNGDNETTFKRYFTDPARLEPVSDNPAHVPITLGNEPFMVVGRVIYAGANL